MQARLTDKFVKELQAPSGKSQIRVTEHEIPGFGIRVTRGGAKAFFLNYTVHGRERRLTIGKYPVWGVQAARDRAKELRRRADAGIDPLDDAQKHREMPTMAALFERYADRKLLQKRPKTVQDQRSIWTRLVEPKLGRRKLDTITYSDIEKLHGEVSKRTPVQANRMLALLNHMFEQAVRWSFISQNPARGVQKNIETPRERFLSHAEQERFLNVLLNLPRTTARLAIELLYYTGARKSEVLEATWDQFDLEKGIWTKPSAHTKQKKTHMVPLNDGALAVLKEAESQQCNSTDYVFPGRNGKPLVDIRKPFKALCRQAKIDDFRVHDLRHSFASRLIDRNASLPQIGALLGHTQINTTLRYSHLELEKLRQIAKLGE